MVWHIVKYWASFFIPAFYKRIQARGLQNINVKGPVIISMNHPNAFTDPIAITNASYPQRLKYLARGDAFKPGIASWVLEQIGIVPIFRIQDGGKEGLKKNDDSYRRVNALLARNAKIIVFTEGLCVQERRLRPLKKGAARMVFGAYEALHGKDLRVVPVGVNYSQPDKFRSTVFYNVGEPIFIKDFASLYAENPAKAHNVFLQTLSVKMKELITHIDRPENDQVVHCMEALLKRSMLREQGLDHRNLYHDYLVTKQITERVNAAALQHQPMMDEFKVKAAAYFDDLRKAGLRDWLIDPVRSRRVVPLNVLAGFILLIIGLPLYAIGLIGNYIPFYLTRRLTKKLAKNKEFYSSFFIASAMLLFPLSYALWFIVLYIAAPNLLIPLSVTTAFMLCAWFSLYNYPLILKTAGMIRALRNKELVKTFAKRREELVTLVNKI